MFATFRNGGFRRSLSAMSLAIAIKAHEGMVLAAESRVTIPWKTASGELLPLAFDNATKLLAFAEPHTHIAAVTFGQATIGIRTAQSFVPEFEATLPASRVNVGEFARRLSWFFTERWEASGLNPPAHPMLGMSFVVAGFDADEPYGCGYTFSVPGLPIPEDAYPDDDFGIRWGGQRDIVDRILLGYDPSLLKSSQTSLASTRPESMCSALFLSRSRRSSPSMGWRCRIALTWPFFSFGQRSKRNA